MKQSIKIGWVFLIFGGALYAVQAIATASATANDTAYEDTAVGKILWPIEKYLPLHVTVGACFALVGAVIVFLIPWMSKGK